MKQKFLFLLFTMIGVSTNFFDSDYVRSNVSFVDKYFRYNVAGLAAHVYDRDFYYLGFNYQLINEKKEVLKTFDVHWMARNEEIPFWVKWTKISNVTHANVGFFRPDFENLKNEIYIWDTYLCAVKINQPKKSNSVMLVATWSIYDEYNLKKKKVGSYVYKCR